MKCYPPYAATLPFFFGKLARRMALLRALR